VFANSVVNGRQQVGLFKRERFGRLAIHEYRREKRGQKYPGRKGLLCVGELEISGRGNRAVTGDRALTKTRRGGKHGEALTRCEKQHIAKTGGKKRSRMWGSEGMSRGEGRKRTEEGENRYFRRLGIQKRKKG